MTWPLVNPTSGYKTLSRLDTVRLLPSTSMTFSLLGIGASFVRMMPCRQRSMQGGVGDGTSWQLRRCKLFGETRCPGPMAAAQSQPVPRLQPETVRGVTALLPLYFVVFAGYVGYSLMITVFTPMLLRSDSPLIAAGDPMSKRTMLLGFLLCLYPLGQFLGSPIMGSLSDRFGRKPVLLISLCITTVSYAFIAVALTVGSLPLLAAASLIAGLAEANILTAQSAIADVSAPQDRNRLFGYIYMSVSAAYIVGPVVGGKLADPALVHWFSYATPFWMAFGLLAVTLLATALLFSETHPVSSRQPMPLMRAFTNLAAVISDTRLRRLYWLNFLFYLAIFGFFRCYPMYLVDEYHLGVSRVSEFVAWVGVPIVIANLGSPAFSRGV